MNIIDNIADRIHEEYCGTFLSFLSGYNTIEILEGMLLAGIFSLRKKQWNTFFYRLIAIFIVIILIFSIFQFAAYNFYIRSIDSEIIKYYSASLKNTARRFDEIVSQVETSLLLMHYENEFQPFKSPAPINAYQIKEICEKVLLSSVKNNKYLENVILLKQDSDILLTARGSNLKSLFFNNAYSSHDYPLETWEKYCLEDFTFRYCPDSTFYSKDFNREKSARLLPLVFKPDRKNSLIIIAFLDIDNILKDIDLHSGEGIYIYKDGSLVYNGSATTHLDNLEFKGSSEYAKYGDFYYFTEKNDNKHITYLKAVSYEEIRENSHRLNTLFVCIIALSIIVSLVVSVLLSIKINNPIKQITKIINTTQPHAKYKANISELEFINASIQKLIIQSSSNPDLDKKNSLLKKYFYQTGLKNIYTEMSEIKDFFIHQNVFSLVYFVVHYKEYFFEQFGNKNNTGTFFLTEYIQKIIEAHCMDGLTFQIESNQIVAIINYNNQSLDIRKVVDGIISKLGNELEYLFLTVAIGKMYTDISYLNTAYSEVYNLLQQQKLGRDIQVLTPDDLSNKSNKFYLDSDQEQSFFNNVRNGNTEECVKFANHILEFNYNKDVRLCYFQKLSMHLVNICVRAFNVSSMELPGTTSIDEVYEKINWCYTLDEFKGLFLNLLTELTTPIRNLKKESDYIKDYVIQYIENHYPEDIYLDLLSEKLNITSNYLSQYFKIQTGVNFVDYLNSVRLNKAKEILAGSADRIEKIARNVGYTNTNSFIRSFKKFFGLTPGEFRKDLLSK